MPNCFYVMVDVGKRLKDFLVDEFVKLVKRLKGVEA